jgi:hypothetical protein
VFTVLEGRMSFYWQRDGMESVWCHVALGGKEAPPQYDLKP